MGYPTNYVKAGSPPSGGPTPGARSLMTGILEKFKPAFNLGIYNPRDVCGNPWPNFKCSPSQHATGLACDFGIPVANRPVLGEAIAKHLVSKSHDLGITETIWNRRRWTHVNGWQSYSGRSPHLDHVHVTIHPDAGKRLTIAEVRATFPQKEIDDMFNDTDRATLVELASRVSRLEAKGPRYVLDMDDANGAIYVIGDSGLTRRWITTIDRLRNLQNTFPIAVEGWHHADVIDVPLIGKEPEFKPR